MKKIIAILMVLMMVSGALFANPLTTSDKTLDLTTTVAGLLNTKITGSSTNLSSFQGASVLADLPITTDTDGMPVAGTFYFNIRTNRTPAYKVQVKATSFIGSDLPTNESRIWFTLATVTGTGISAISSVASVDTPTAFVDFYTFTKVGTGTQVDSRPISVTLDADSFANATQDAYSAEVIFHIVSQS